MPTLINEIGLRQLYVLILGMHDIRVVRCWQACFRLIRARHPYDMFLSSNRIMDIFGSTHRSAHVRTGGGHWGDVKGGGVRNAKTAH